LTSGGGAGASYTRLLTTPASALELIPLTLSDTINPIQKQNGTCGPGKSELLTPTFANNPTCG